MDRTDRVLVFIVIVALASAVWLAAGRARLERANRTVEIVVDADDAQLVAAAAGRSLPSYLAELREAGANALAVHERTVGDLEEEGRLLAISVSGTTSLLSPDPRLAALIAPALAARLPQARVEFSPDPPAVSLRMPAKDLAQIPVLLEPESLAAAEAAGLAVVARPRNFPGATAAAVEASLREASAVGAKLVVFDKEEVLGYDGLLRVTASAMEQEDLTFGFVEMAQQRGEEALARARPRRVVRVHSISENDMLTMTPSTAVPRYARAAEERNIRVIYVRLITRANDDPATYNTKYVRSIAQAIRADGFTLGAAQPFSAPRGWPPRWPRALVALGVLAGGMLLLRRYLPLPAAWSWALFALILVLGAALGLLRPPAATALGGLGAVVVFPTLGLFWALQGQSRPETRPGLAPILGTSIARLVGATAISVVGGLLTVGLYSRVSYLSGIGAFSGVKPSLVLPLLLILTAVAADLSGRIEPLSRWYPRLRVRAAQILGTPVNVLAAGVVVVALAAVGLVLTRSGNQPVLSPSGLELKLRSFLEVVLAVRPRTKEFLLGYPALMLGVALTLRGRRVWLPLVAVGAALGEVSVANTLCHFHTPLTISLARIANGLWVGAIVGAIVLLGWRLLLDRRPSRP